MSGFDYHRAMDGSTPAGPPRGAVVSVMRAFLAGEAGSGMVLIAAALVAILLVNLGGADLYHHLFDLEVGPVLSARLGPMTPHLWINDGLMALFFLVVGLEIKREWLDGRLSSWRSRRLPFAAALAGMILPAVVYLAFAGGTGDLARGWAIPAATDIAFALGVLALLGNRVPTTLRLFVTTVAIVDDIGAILIIALAYTDALDFGALAAAAVLLAGLWGLNRAGVRSAWVYGGGFALVWYAMLLSGVHATVAGVLTALTVPIRCTPGAPDAADSTLHRMEHGLHPWSAWLIVPLFGFANAGVVLPADMASALLAPATLGIALGLFLGKQLGVFGASWVAIRLGWAARPPGATWAQLYGAAILCGIGFTMSLFITLLAFTDAALIEQAKMGVLLGSLLSALAGLAVLRLAPRHPDHDRIEAEQAACIAADGDAAPDAP